MLVYDALKENLEAAKRGGVEIKGGTNPNSHGDPYNLFTGYLFEFKNKMDETTFDKLVSLPVKDTRFFFGELIIEVENTESLYDYIRFAEKHRKEVKVDEK